MTHRPTRLEARAALIAAASWATMAAVALSTTPDGGSRVVLDTPAEHVGHIAFAAALVLTVPVLVALHRHQHGAAGRLGLAGTAVAVAGCAAQAVVIGTIVVLGEEPSWFGAAAPPAILAWVAGSVALGVATRRAGVLPTWVGTVLPLVTALAIVGSEAGTSLGIAIYLVAVGLRLERAAGDVLVPAVRTSA